MLKFGETPLEGEGHAKKSVRLSMNDGPMETVGYMLVNIWCMLDWIIRLAHKTSKINFLGISAQLLNAQNETLLWPAEMN